MSMVRVEPFLSFSPSCRRSYTVRLRGPGCAGGALQRDRGRELDGKCELVSRFQNGTASPRIWSGSVSRQMMMAAIGCRPPRLHHAAGGAGKREAGSEIDRWIGLQGCPRTELGGKHRVVAQFRSGHRPIPVLFECYRIRTDSGMPRLGIRFSTSHLMMPSTR